MPDESIEEQDDDMEETFVGLVARALEMNDQDAVEFYLDLAEEDGLVKQEVLAKARAQAASFQYRESQASS
jgi:hypothetical protein